MYRTSSPNLLLHLCCAPCSSSVVERLRSNWHVTGYFYNPNIHPEAEYRLRLKEMTRYAQSLDIPLIEGSYDVEDWFNLTAGLEEEPERGLRCEICFRLRLEATARRAHDLDMDYFTSTLTISPHKDAAIVRKTGEEAGQRCQVSFLSEDFKKEGGFQRSIVLSKEAGLFRQSYCGCCYSRKGA